MKTPEEFLSKLDIKQLAQLVREAFPNTTTPPEGSLFERFQREACLNHATAARLASLKLADEVDRLLDECGILVGEEARRFAALVENPPPMDPEVVARFKRALELHHGTA